MHHVVPKNMSSKTIDPAAISLIAVFSGPTNGLLWIGQAATVEEAVRSLNRELPIADTEPSDDEDFISVVSVSPAEAAMIEALEWGAPVPELANEFTEVSYSTALEIVSG